MTSTVSEDALLEVGPLNKAFGASTVLRDVSLTVRKGEFMTLLGPSGCGKTTTLRIIAGFETPDGGRVRLGGVDVTDTPAYERDVHTVFQHYALFPHLSVCDNIAFGMRMDKVPEEEIKKRVPEALAMVKLSGFEARRIQSLSGGQMQRVALARAIAGRPAVLLLDEPLGALDLKLRKEMQLELKGLQRRLGIAFIYVTHDQEEAMTMSDRIAVFNHGRIEQVGTPGEIYETPKTSFVADFIGGANIFSAEVLPGAEGRAHLRLEDEYELDVPLDADETLPAVGRRVKIAIRPERVKVFYKDELPFGLIRFDAILKDTVFLGDACQIYLQMFKKNPERLTIAWAGGDRYAAHDDMNVPVIAAVQPEDVYILEQDNG
ncbi:MAG: ABC transporter ATP-binding protein [Elusimicrobia bacterium]|nr:ABC transporter ATP-binding protein [Elusimicrobiota bacterium]